MMTIDCLIREQDSHSLKGCEVFSQNGTHTYTDVYFSSYKPGFNLSVVRFTNNENCFKLCLLQTLCHTTPYRGLDGRMFLPQITLLIHFTGWSWKYQGCVGTTVLCCRTKHLVQREGGHLLGFLERWEVLSVF